MDHATIGQIVKAHYKSGTYIGEVMEERGENYLIKVLAVIKHPLQGDLHNYGKTEDVFFHQRKALSYQEKMNVSKPAIHPFEEDVPDYLDSLKLAIDQLRTKLSKENKPFNEAALRSLDQLEQEYFKKRK
ncbi:kinase-associated lipoprotein B [Aquibacillus koreensis]|uniref:Kinase-associated lipoprotein B n=1 Tax=Aquibacillus koreensis TaxID=279446 RepID=A0A9X4AHP2_9BACI|nr:kinase-associated lipoprotein B [Aquibacillus koreensis]MCT2535866.1 kinase-associated lipoprotein B [Aquibacillus koreensis]MDC3420322.1 kinase-associated lipoprotein B [Aquibacillus koreensis]